MRQPMMDPGMTEPMRQCIENCLDCHTICLEIAGRHLRGDDGQARPGQLRLLLDCAEICQTSANFMLRGSDLHTHTCTVCAAICDECARECEQVGEQTCADVCRRCAYSCRQMAT